MASCRSKRTVLLVDDDLSVRRSVSRVLRHKGYDVAAAASLREARAEVESPPAPKYCILDVHLPDGHGLHFIEDLLKLDQSVRIVVLSAHVTTPLTVDAVKRGVTDVILKPALPELLLAALEPELALSYARRATTPCEPFRMQLDRVEREHIDFVMRRCNWNISRAARELGLHRQSLQRKLRKGI